MSTFIELEIQYLLSKISDLDVVAINIIDQIESKPENLNKENITALYKFLLNSGRYQKLIQFANHHLNNPDVFIAWPYLLEAISLSGINLNESELSAFIQGIESCKAHFEASRSLSFQSQLPQLRDWRNERKFSIQKKYTNKKASLMDDLLILRSQQLVEGEKKVLEELNSLFPGDIEIERELKEYKQRNALEVLARRTPKRKSLETQELTKLDTETEVILNTMTSSMLEYAQQYPEMAFDLALLAFMIEAYEATLQILNFAELTPSALWLRLETLLKARRYVELLSETTQVEIKLAHEPETFFATAYLRAQALWGLGQKFTAIQVIEGLLAARPNYRSASALYSIWNDQK